MSSIKRTSYFPLKMMQTSSYGTWLINSQSLDSFLKFLKHKKYANTWILTRFPVDMSTALDFQCSSCYMKDLCVCQFRHAI